MLVGKKNEEQTPQVVLHTDQGSVYSSQAFRQAHEHYNILRSMSKVGTPTDNAIIEAINGWIKEELFLDFGWATTKDVPKLLDEYAEDLGHYFRQGFLTQIIQETERACCLCNADGKPFNLV